MHTGTVFDGRSFELKIEDGEVGFVFSPSVLVSSHIKEGKMEAGFL